MRYELFPTTNVSSIIKYLPKNSNVSVTSSVKHGVKETQAMTQQLLAADHSVCPHFAARLVSGAHETKQLALWTRTNGIKKVFIVAGDCNETNYYTDSLQFMEDFLNEDHGVECVSFAIYPDGHPLVDHAELVSFALRKNKLISERGLRSEAVSQMCFDGSRIVDYVQLLRSNDFTSSVYVGIPGIISYFKLFSIGTSLGVSNSLRFLHKNANAASMLLSPKPYDPSALISQIAQANEVLGNEGSAGAGIEGVHVFTFNALETTVSWAAQYSK